MVGFGPPKMVDREVNATIRLTPAQLQQWYRAAQPPNVSADALLVYDVDAARTLYSRSASEPLPPASLTKLMTALLVLESGRLEERIVVLEEDRVGGATMGLAVGEVITVGDLLWGLLVASGNDSAMALARYLGGDVDTFVAAMNTRAADLGLADTHFANPTGFDADGHASTAQDTLALTLHLLDYPLFREIVATKEKEVAGHSLRNTNEMLGFYPGVDGVKTGTTALAEQCLVSSITENNHRLLIVVMGSNDRYADVANLHALYQANYEWVVGDISQLSVMNRLYDEDGRVIPLRAEGEAVSVLRHRWGDSRLTAYRDINGDATDSAAPAQALGVVAWRMGDVLVANSDLTVR